MLITKRPSTNNKGVSYHVNKHWRWGLWNENLSTHQSPLKFEAQWNTSPIMVNQQWGRTHVNTLINNRGVQNFSTSFNQKIISAKKKTEVKNMIRLEIELTNEANVTNTINNNIMTATRMNRRDRDYAKMEKVSRRVTSRNSMHNFSKMLNYKHDHEINSILQSKSHNSKR